MRVPKTSSWLKGLIFLAVPIALVLSGVVMGAPHKFLAGTITLAADEDDPSTFVFLGGLGKGAFLGVSLEEETELDEGGARVTHVVDDSPAAAAGIEEGDVIVGFDGETIRGPVALTKEIRAKEPGDTVSLVVVRDGSRRTLEAELGDRSERWKFEINPDLEELEHLDNFFIPEIEIPDIDFELQEELLKERLGALKDLQWTHCEEDDEDCILGNSFFMSWSSKPRLGVQLVEVTPELRQHLGADEDAGVMVSKVIAGTPAESAGIRVGDLIVALDGEKISGTSKLRHELQERAGETFDVEVIRDRTPLRIEVTLPEPDDEPASGPRAWVRPAPRAVPAPPAPAAAPRAVPRPAPPAPPALREVVREELERERAVARAEVRELRERLERERVLARAEARELREGLARERALARAEAREGLERERALALAEHRKARAAREDVRRSIDRARDEYRREMERMRQEELKRRAASMILL